jgi:elongation factor P hydroxylase
MVVNRKALTDTEIAGCFNRALGRPYRVRLIGGSPEPLYLPGQHGWSVIRYTRDYAASALHELAHWCIAGKARRRKVDYGYWYAPPPRSAAAQKAFAAVELPVQALESVLARTCGLDFQVSVDDVEGGSAELAEHFSMAVAHRAAGLDRGKLPPRARRLIDALERFRELA